ncbi:MAG: (3R)-hydroxymyristoyl-ACP dehydratase [Bacteroidetes bacterium ADurb.Bin408]|nr:MAG: (3R)-hydroxymyristoyl-ACP dehydratase [Bacteroidetes bacterium ADurb.Bin408]
MEDIRIISQKIINRLPYLPDFLFVDEISSISTDNITGHYTFTKNAFFYKSHFKHIPVTPGVVLIEMMGQTGLVALLMYIEGLHENNLKFHPILQNIECSFLKPVNINDRLTVVSEKEYYRNGILKSHMSLMNSNKELSAILIGQIKMIVDY